MHRAFPFLLTAVAALAQVPVDQPPELPALRIAADRVVSGLRLDGAGLVVVRGDGVLHESLHGKLAATDVVPIASASKWLAVATVLTLVDEGVLDLDRPVARYVNEFDRADKRMVTLRQCLACTAGFAPRLGERMRGWDMAKFAKAAADAPLRDGPGVAFRYGGLGFEVAALAAERATGKSWHTLFAERIAKPLGMTDTAFGELLPVGAGAGTTALPWVAGGAVSTLDDYRKFVQMLAAGGEFGGRRIVAAASLAQMFADQVPSLVEVRAEALAGDGVRYGLGTWLQPLDGGIWRATDPGAFGFTPWLDQDLGVGGVFAVRDRAGRVLPQLQGLQEEVRAAVRSPAVAGREQEVSFEFGGRTRRYLMQVPAGADAALGLPLVLVLHGGGGNAEFARDATGFAELASREGFLAVFPDGTGVLRSKLLTWNSGGLPVYAVEQDVDDVGFLRAVVADVQRRVPVDPERVFAVGHSNGGMMVHRLAREASDLFAGVAAVAGAMDFTAKAGGPIAAMIVHGTADEHVPYGGGRPKAGTGRSGDRVDASVQDAIDYYTERNGLLAYPKITEDGKVKVAEYARRSGGEPAAAPLRVVTLEGGGHAWPGTDKLRRRGDDPFPYPASEEIWKFFAPLRKAHATPAVPR